MLSKLQDVVEVCQEVEKRYEQEDEIYIHENFRRG